MSSQNIVPPSNSLVKYAHPVLVSTSGKRKDQPSQINQHTEDILNSILPPREYTMDKQQLWIQSVLPTPATKADVMQLQEELDKRLQQRQARETGICPVREELYAQCFDELIRQITINCAERGLLLVRVRDEIRMTIQAYQQLYESSIAYGMRKSLQSEQYKTQMSSQCKQMEIDIDELQKQVEALENNIRDIEQQDEDFKNSEFTKHNEQVEFLRNTNMRFKQELERILTQPSGKK